MWWGLTYTCTLDNPAPSTRPVKQVTHSRAFGVNLVLSNASESYSFHHTAQCKNILHRRSYSAIQLLQSVLMVRNNVIHVTNTKAVNLWWLNCGKIHTICGLSSSIL